MRLISTARLAWGGLLIWAPGATLRTVAGRPATPSQARVLRVLGTRHVVQASLDLARPTPGVLRLGAAIDLLHAATCAAAVALLPAWRRIAAVDGAGAVGFAARGLARAGLGRPEGTSSPRGAA